MGYVYEYCGFVFLAALFFAYTTAFQSATLFWGKKISVSPESTGLQDAITPKSQTYRIYLMLLFIISAIVAGFIIKWYIGLLCLPAILFVATMIKSFFLPRTQSGYYKKRILINLENRLAHFQETLNTDSIIAIAEVIKRLKNAEP
jgi:hypothetical protein